MKIYMVSLLHRATITSKGEIHAYIVLVLIILFHGKYTVGSTQIEELECGPMPNLMVALPNIGGALCSTPQNLADVQY